MRHVLSTLLVVGVLSACSSERLTGPAAEDAARQYQATADLAAPSPIFLLDGEEINQKAALALAPEAIESIEVVKGAAAVKLYGERASAGVIQIRSKAKRSAPAR